MCDAEHVCKTCAPLGGCGPVAPAANSLFRVMEHGLVSGEDAMAAEIAARGPIVCGMCVTPAFEAYTGGIFVDASGCTELMHDISIAGFGVAEDGTKFWVGRNSWGSYWGESGWFRLQKGVNALGIEADCDWAVPVLPAMVLPAA